MSDDREVGYGLRLFAKLRIDYLLEPSDENRQRIEDLQRKTLLEHLPECFDPGSEENAIRKIDKEYQLMLYVLGKNGVADPKALTLFELEWKLMCLKEEQDAIKAAYKQTE